MIFDCTLHCWTCGKPCGMVGCDIDEGESEVNESFDDVLCQSCFDYDKPTGYKHHRGAFVKWKETTP